MTKMLSLHSGPTVLLNRIAREIDFKDTINRLLKWDSLVALSSQTHGSRR
ncbi:hypothetical protein [Ferroacidibacillus organovorans]|nr:hypothetical protein [Ferroacidibacillus organovorans]